MRITSYAAIALLMLVAGCTGLLEKAEKRIDQTDSSLTAMAKDVGRNALGTAGKSASVVQDEGIWIGKSPVKLKQPALPPIFDEPATFDRTVRSLSEIAERITLRSGIPVKISPDALAISSTASQPSGAAPGSGAPAAAAPAPWTSAAGQAPGTRMNAPIHITYANGTFRGLLDTIAARFGVYWRYTNGMVQFLHTESRTFRVSAIPGDSSLTATVVSSASTPTGGTSDEGGGSGGGGSGGSGGGSSAKSGGVMANNVQNTAMSSQLAVYSSIEKSIKAMLSAYGKVVASPATGTLTVVDTPDVLDRIADFMEAENKSLSRQVVINVTVLAVTLNDSDAYGINWNLIYNDLYHRYGIRNTVASSESSTSFSAGILGTANSNFAGSSVVINALSEQGKVRRHTTASVVTLNNQPVPVQVARQTSYLKSSQTTVTALVGSTTTLTPGTVTSGFNMSILPHILNNGTVLLQFSTDMSSLRGFRTVVSNGSSIETPELDTRNFLQRVAMRSNETLIISGFEQTEDNLGRQGVGDPRNYVLGGGFRARADKEVIVVLITPATVGS